MLCPFGTAAFYGRCKQLVSKINGLHIKVDYHLDIIWNATRYFSNYGNGAVWKETSLQLLMLLNINSICEISYILIVNYTEGSTSTPIIGFVIVLELTTECDYGMTFTKLSDMHGKVIEINVDGTAMLKLLVQADKQNYPKHGYHILFEHIFKPGEQAITVSLDDMSCPRVELNYLDLELLSYTDIKKRTAFASFFLGSTAEQTDARVVTCLDKYIFVMSQISRAAPSAGKITLQMLPAILSMFTLLKVPRSY